MDDVEGKPDAPEPQENQNLEDTKQGDSEDTKSGDEDISTRWADRSKDELVEIAKQQDSMIGRLKQEKGSWAEELKSLKDEIGGLKKATQPSEDLRFPEPEGMDTGNEMPPEAAQQQVPPSMRQDWNWGNPSESVKKIAKDAWAEEQEKQRKQAAQGNYQRTRAAFESMAPKVFKKYPHLFDGIEGDTKEAVLKFFGEGIKAGHDVSPWLNQEQTWVKAGQSVRMTREEYDKMDPNPKTKPMSSQPTEKPSSTGSRSDPDQELMDGIRLTAEDRAWGRSHGHKTDEAIKKVMVQEMKTRMGG